MYVVVATQLDCGANARFMDLAFASEHPIPIKKLEHPALEQARKLHEAMFELATFWLKEIHFCQNELPTFLEISPYIYVVVCRWFRNTPEPTYNHILWGCMILIISLEVRTSL